MSSRLNRVEEWEALAEAASYAAQELAVLCGVSLRQLERYFAANFQVVPQSWLRAARMRRAVQLLAEKKSIKETALLLCYRYPEHFARDFKGCFGMSPTKFILSTSCVGSDADVVVLGGAATAQLPG